MIIDLTKHTMEEVMKLWREANPKEKLSFKLADEHYISTNNANTTYILPEIREWLYRNVSGGWHINFVLNSKRTYDVFIHLNKLDDVLKTRLAVGVVDKD